MPSKSVADYLSMAIDISDLTQREIAEAVGYSKPNIISMMKLGQTKIPIDKIPAFARALGLDPADFTRRALREYMPEAWKAIEGAFGEAVTQREKALLGILREEETDRPIELDEDKLTKIRELLRAP